MNQSLDGTYDLDAVRRRAAEQMLELADAQLASTVRQNDNGMRTVLVRDPHVSETERGWHAYGPFEREQAVMVADDLRMALDSASMPEITVELVGWEPWEGLT